MLVVNFWVECLDSCLIDSENFDKTSIKTTFLDDERERRFKGKYFGKTNNLNID